VKRYSEFINFPIYIWASKEVDVEVPADEDESSEEEESSMYTLRIQFNLDAVFFVCPLLYIKINILIVIYVVFRTIFYFSIS
jgi:hypothetical protein